MAETQQIFALIPKIMHEVGGIAKGRKNVQQGYAFRGIDEVYAALQGPLSSNGVFYVPEVTERDVTERQTKNGGTLFYTTLKMRFTFYAPDGSSVTAVTCGEAMDSGDKSTNKAMSAALKYALLQVFCIPTEEREANDADYQTHEVAPAKPAAPKPNASATSAPSASEQTVIQLKELLDSVEMPTGWAAKMLKAKGVRKWEELTEEQVTKAIKYIVDQIAAGKVKERIAA